MDLFSSLSMRSLVLVAACLVAVAALPRKRIADLDKDWEHFKNIYGKSYVGGEERRRRLIWDERVMSIIHHNLKADFGLHSFRRGLSKYSDLSHEEYMSNLNGFRVNENFRMRSDEWRPVTNASIPEEVDWRKQGAVTQVKDQEECGSCWAFSSTGSLEGQHKRKTGKLVSLSEQNLIDCVKDNNGCGGGFVDSAFEYVKNNSGIDTEEAYSYENKVRECRFDRAAEGATCVGHVDIPSGDENALKQAVATVGPISVAINAAHEAFHTYKSGVYNEPDCPNSIFDLTHAVLVIGYGTENGAEYWLVKNSWGTSYGESGYVKMTRNAGNQCGIATMASYPLV